MTGGSLRSRPRERVKVTPAAAGLQSYRVPEKSRRPPERVDVRAMDVCIMVGVWYEIYCALCA